MRKRTFCRTETCRKWASLNENGFCPTCQPPSHVAVDEELDCVCGHCEEALTDEGNANHIGCDLCPKWFHPKCIGSDELVKLIVSLSESPGSSSILGSFIWICAKCTDTDKTVKISKECCELILPDKTNTSSDMRNKGNMPICKNYRHGSCNQGNNCKFSHPAKCLDYCRYGREGCNGGFDKCKLLHPVLCRESLNFKRCYDPLCTLAHLKGTNRNPNIIRNTSNQSRYMRNTQNQHQRFIPFDSQKLGFKNYQSYRKRGYASNPNEEPPQETSAQFSYNENDFPHFTNHDGQTQTNTNSYSMAKPVQNFPPPQVFLELMNSIREMQATQLNFQQELANLRSVMPQVQRMHFPVTQQAFPNQHRSQVIPEA